MTAAVVIVGTPRDPLARAIRRHVAGEMLFISPYRFPGTFELARDGTLRSGMFIIEGRPYPWEKISSLIVRTGTAWALRRSFPSLDAGLIFHERRSAWCATLSVFSGSVIDRLPPAWFLEPVLYRKSLGHALASRLGLNFHSGSFGNPVRPCAAVLIGRNVFPAGLCEDSRTLASWLASQSALIVRWQEDFGHRIVRVDATLDRREWTISTVDPVPSLARLSRAILNARGAALAAELK